MKNKKAITRKALDTIFDFVFRNSSRLWCGLALKIGSWLCPENSNRHFFEYCICKNYCYEHGRDEMFGCSVCAILEFNYKDYPLERLDDYFLQVKNGYYSLEEGCTYYSDEYKYLA
jgi:hypothetical protein